MQKSESIAALAGALAKAQAEILGAKKDSENPFFKSKYADLAAVWDACRGPLTKNELSIVQTPRTEITENSTVIYVGTLLSHSSGEWISEELSAIPVKDDPQGIGSCITYLRRYALSAFTGVAPEDDDGNAASHGNGAQRPAGRPKTAPQSLPDAEREGLMVSVKHAAKLLNSLGDVPPWTVKRCNDFANENFNATAGVDGLTNPQLTELAKMLSAKVDELKKAPKDDRTEAERKAKIAAIQKKYNPQAIAQGMKDTYPDSSFDELTLDQLIRLEEELIPF
jgi:hypothetical protein